MKKTGDDGGCGDLHSDTLIKSTTSSTLIYTFSSSYTNSINTSSTFTIPSSNGGSSVDDSSRPRRLFLEIILISAQDLLQISKSKSLMRTYAVAWVHRKHKLTSSVDEKGHTNPTWNDRFAFLVPSNVVVDDAELTIEIYNISWFRNALIGTVRVLISNLITKDNNPRFGALQISHLSGKFQGKLNMGVSLHADHDFCTISTIGSCWTLNHQKEENKVQSEHNSNNDKDKDSHHHDWTTNQDYENGQQHVITREGFESPEKVDHGSELYSDIGPSASIVAAEIARKSSLIPVVVPAKENDQLVASGHVGSRSIVEEMTMEEATAKGLNNKYRRRAQMRRHSYSGGDDDGGLCFLLWKCVWI